MGVEVKGAGDGVVIADRGCNDGCCCGNRNSGWGSVNTWTNESPLKRLCYRELLRSWDWINLNNSKNYAK